MTPPPYDPTTPDWLEWLSPFAGLPLWAEAAIFSAGVALTIFIVHAVGRFLWEKLWKLGQEEEE